MLIKRYLQVVKKMLIKIGAFDISECWDGVFYKKLSEFPQITDWEIQNILAFMSHGKKCT